MDLKSKIREVQDFPKPGIGFKDITTILQDGEVYHYAIDQFIKSLEGVDYDVIIGPEARGFLVGAPLAYALKKSFVPVRKPGKLPYETAEYTYELEYGTDTLQMHIDAVKPGQKVVIVDDLLATGGTVNAVAKLVEQMGGEVVKMVFLIDLTFLNGRELLKDYDIDAIVEY
ncbi:MULTISPECIES: adenine phosphoribosyltransferase [unclassified Fusibacter]|uniref:adenine phosphoribosyltransferase n=1 Tax=unclassified Fusibacter TaxID=2624464 RepID=UPI001011F8CA|nr:MULTISPECIES: adenine phosphoribosyltransferase [unclassified Fusibacter]MCK8059052.1 adenine phosphoribosyltransferase [Fusibacter sp. A2]NPE22463.1 adenine phosphoribosyltransferase [Fusibacter sp. A1]RXV60567.1 adenine phosphoribosyltransferase [Fusibacter sp. A1]